MSRATTSKQAVELPPLRSWDGLFGHEAVCAEVQTMLAQNSLPQVILFEGRDGIGKRKLMAAVLGLMFCEEQRACAVCEGCRAVQHGYHPDVLWIESEATLKVAEAEKVQEHLTVRAQQQAGGRGDRVAVLIDIEELTDQAANRLLKTLEEPPAQSRILLSCSRVSQLLPTIRSRLVRWHVQPPAMAKSLEWLEAKANEEGLQHDPKMLRQALERFGLSPGRALQALREDQALDAESVRRLETLLFKPMDGAHLAEMQELLKAQGWKADHLAQRLELLLNRYYKWSLGLTVPETHPVDFKRIKHWRSILQEVYRAGGSGHNHLNSQMIAEAWTSSRF